MNHNPGDSDQTNKDDLVRNHLTPEQTKDDQAKPVSRDSEILRDVPPHHGN